MNNIKVRMHKMLEMIIENGINYGWNRAYKHNDSPSEDEIKDKITTSIMNEFHEWFEVD